MDNTKIIVDGSNIAFLVKNYRRKPKIRNLKIMISHLEKITETFPAEFTVIVDASLRHHIDSKDDLEELIRIGKVIQAPSNHSTDEFIIEYAQRHPENTIIISNDRFSEFKTENLTICSCLIIFDDVIIKPMLEQILEVNNSKIKEVEMNVCKV